MLGSVWRWVKRLAAISVLLAVAGAVALWMQLSEYEKELPSTDELRNYAPPQVTRVLARDGTLLAELFIERRTVVSIDRISKKVKVAILAAEDADFYKHEGLDYLGMLRALAVNLRHQQMRQGGSTITQQVVKNVLLTHERTFERKARELLLARRIEQELSKDEILELYLNHIYFGHGRYGVEEAARYYFGKTIGEVTLAEAAMIAALPKGPSLYSPRVDYDRAKRRRDAVLDQMALKGFANSDAVDEAKSAPIALAPAAESLAELAPEAVSEAKRELRKLVGGQASRGGYTITTTIDPELQAAARKAVRKNLNAYAKRHGLLAPIKKRAKSKAKPFQGTPRAKGHRVYTAVVTGANDVRNELHVRVGTATGTVRLATARRYNPTDLEASKFAEKGALLRVSAVLERGIGADGVPTEYRLELGPQSALVAIDPRRREIRAIVGSYEAVRGGLDRASFAHRQPGSTFKPLVYSYGIHSRTLTPATIVPIERNPLPNGDPAPPLRLRNALAQSINPAAEWALEHVGAEAVVSWAGALGIESKMKPTSSLALGAYEVTPRELAAVYATFAAQGTYEKPILVTRVVGPDGEEISLPTQPPIRRVFEPAEAYVVTSLLTSVIQHGTGRRARKLNLPLAGKTGTSNDAKDAWFAGYSPEMVAVVWTGFDDAVSLGRREQGAVTALPAWMAFMKSAHSGHAVKAWARPEGVIEIEIDPLTGLLPYVEQEDAITEIFLAGTEPSELAPPPEDGAGGGDGGADGDPYDEEPSAELDSPKASAAPTAAPIAPESAPEPKERPKKQADATPPAAATAAPPPF
jgi:penicillin-binding protein 1A